MSFALSTFLPLTDPLLMLTFLNGLEPAAWAGIVGLVGGFGAALAAALKGLKKDPVEVGGVKPDPDRVEYVLAEVRQISASIRSIETTLEGVDRRTELIRIDTGILRDRD